MADNPELKTQKLIKYGNEKFGLNETTLRGILDNASGSEDLTTELNTQDGLLEMLETEINKLPNNDIKEPKPIYGVSWTNDATTTMTRTDDAVEMTYAISNGKVTSDFDKVFPYNQMKRQVIDGNTFVYIPAMYFRVTTDADKKITAVAVSETQGDGDGWYATRAFYYGAYGASDYGTFIGSVSGKYRLYSITRAEARDMAMDVGTNYHQRDLYASTILMFLWWIEFATKDSASVMIGTLYDEKTGNTDAFYNEEEGENFCVSGYDTSTQQMVWHGIEDYIGNGYEWVDGMTGNGVKGGEQYVSDDYTLYDDYSSGSGSKMSALSFNSLPPRDGYRCLEAIGWDETKPFLCQPIALRHDLDFTTGFCDYVGPDNNAALSLGCAYPTEATDGVSSFATDAISVSIEFVGCRLLLNI